MRTHVRAVVVGGGAVGAGIAYALAKAGWTDTVLLERDELTSGSTWHAAGLLPLFNMGYATSHIHDHSVKLYKMLEAETGLNAGFSVVGNLRMAQTDARMDEYQLYAATAETLDIPHEFLTPAQIRDLWPLVRTEDLKGALFHPTDGYINPADVTQALAKGARQRGVEIVRKAQVDAYRWTGAAWIVSGRIMTDRGGNLVATDEPFEITAEHVVTATGNHAQRTARLLGIKIPAIPVEHQYIVTEPDPALVEFRKTHSEHPVLRDADARWYVREERGGWILGPYEDGAPARFEYAVPEGFRADLFPLDLDRIEAEYMSMIHRLPSSESVGLKDDFNGPICYTPDGNPLVGPAPGLRNMWLAEGFSFGITAAGGTGHYLAQMMVEGEAEIDMAALDPRRYGPWITTEYAARKNEECYSHVFLAHYPDEEREACRPLRTAPCYDRVKAKGAQFGQVNGWERPIYYAPQGFDDHASRSFRRGGWWQYAVEEAKAIRESVGMVDATAFAKHILKGPGATAFLDWFTCNKLPKVGRISLTYALTAAGTTRTEYTIARVAEDAYYLVSAGAWAAYDQDFLKKAIEDRQAEFGPMHLADVTTQFGVFAIAGPSSRDLLAQLIRDPEPATALGNKRFPWLSVRNVELMMCPVTALRVAYTGELGWELHHPMEMQNYLFDRLMAAGEPLGLKLVGARAQNWLRQEKSYRAFGTELGRDATPLEADLPRFVDLSKDFHGKDEMVAKGIRSTCVTLLIDGPDDADPWGREALYAGAERVGRLTSGGYSVAFGKSIGMGYVAPAHAAIGTRLEVRMQGRLWPAEIVQDSPYDPQNARSSRRVTAGLRWLFGVSRRRDFVYGRASRSCTLGGRPRVQSQESHMAETPVLEAVARAGVGKGAARSARREGFVPGVIYGGHEAPQAINVKFNTLFKQLKAGRFLSTLINVRIDGKDNNVICRSVQRDVVKDLPVHVDFLRLTERSRIALFIPVVYTNREKSPGLKRGGVLTEVRPEIELMVTAGDIPESIVIDLTGAEIHDSIHISAVQLPAGATPTITDRDFVIASIQAPSGLRSEDNEAEEGAEG